MDNLESLIIQSAELMLIGMGTVFIILTMLIFLISLVSRLLPEEDQPMAVGNQPNSQIAQTTPTQKNNQTELVAVISSAIKAFKKNHPSN